MRIYQFEQDNETENKNIQLSFLLTLYDRDHCTVYTFNNKMIDSFPSWIYNDVNRYSKSGFKYRNKYKYIGE
jgi:hypothetical protein